MVVFSVSMLVLRHARPVHWGGRLADGVVGLLGGVLGGAAGLFGPLPTIWATLRGWSKSESRSVLQAFNLTVLILALGLHMLSGFLTKPLLLATMAALPETIIGAACGAWAYRRLSDKRFRELILVLLGMSGAALLWTSIS